MCCAECMLEMDASACLRKRMNLRDSSHHSLFSKTLQSDLPSIPSIVSPPWMSVDLVMVSNQHALETNPSSEVRQVSNVCGSASKNWSSSRDKREATGKAAL